MKLYWWTAYHAEGKNNFGDLLTPELFKRFGIKHEYSENDYEAISTGSIANKARKNTIVLGSGILSDQVHLNAKADWRFVRGPYTRLNVIRSGGKCPEIYGDPAMLLPLFIKPEEKEYDTGIFPHYNDYPYVASNVEALGLDWLVIDPLTKDVEFTTKQVTKCRKIISSSLHGIICAHAYGIPAAWVKFSEKLPGDGVKFKDHYAALNLIANPRPLNNPDFQVGHLDIKPLVKIFESLR